MKTYSKNDILDLQLKYKDNHEVLDLVDAVDGLQDEATSAEDALNELDDAIGNADELRAENKVLSERIKQLENEVKK
jgi:predicted  nucleic acid-binding Zn-ribbon protein